MPHGGGHVSHGGGGGGGHHHFGHHHHSHNRNRHYGGVVYTGGGYYYRSRYRGWIWGGVGVILVVTIIVSVSCSVSLSKEEDEEKHFTPGDSRIKKFDNFFCSGVKPKTSYDFEDQHAMAYIIKQNPPLSVRNTVTFNDAFTLFQDDYNFWHFYLYKNSNITLEGCVKDGVGYWFYIVKGTSKWNDWKDYASSSKAVFNAYITAPCDGQITHRTFKIRSNDHYYIAYYNSGISEVKGNQTLRIDRYEYSAPKSADQLNCSFAGPNTESHCDLHVPMFSDQSKVLVTFPNVHKSKQEDEFIVDIDCIPRIEAYLIVVLPSVALLSLSILCLVLCCMYRRKLKSRKYQPLLGGSHTNNPSPLLGGGDPSAQPPFVPPPSVNPDYSANAPPPYKP